MIQKLRSLSLLAKIFVGLTLALLIPYILLFVINVRQNVSMDPNSYNCLHDSMMKPFCADPYGTAVGWSFIELALIAWPLMFAWLVAAIMLIRRKLGWANPPQKPTKQPKAKSTPKKP